MKLKRTAGHLVIISVICLGRASLSSADTLQTHDVPMFHNDDGLGLLQDCRFMRAIALGEITEIPTTVNARSTNCLASIKSVVQIAFSMKNTGNTPVTCIPSIEPDWFEVLDHVTMFLENQTPETLATETYGVWILRAVEEQYPC